MISLLAMVGCNAVCRRPGAWAFDRGNAPHLRDGLRSVGRFGPPVGPVDRGGRSRLLGHCRTLGSITSDAGRFPQAIYLAPSLALLTFVLVQYLRYILQAPVVTFVVLCAAASTYVMLGLLWTMAYVLDASIEPNAFASTLTPNTPNLMTGFNAFYISFVTLSTVGYGDIVPVSKVARMLATMEAITGTLYVAMLIARLVSMHASTRSEHSK